MSAYSPEATWSACPSRYVTRMEDSLIHRFGRCVSYASAFRLMNFVAISCYVQLLSMQGHSLFASVTATIALTVVAMPALSRTQASV